MKSPSTRMKSLLSHNRDAFVSADVFLITVLMLLLCALPLAAAPLGISPRGLPPTDVSPVRSALAPTVVGEEDLITLLSFNLGGRDIAVAAWSNMSLSERQKLRD